MRAWSVYRFRILVCVLAAAGPAAVAAPQYAPTAYPPRPASLQTVRCESADGRTRQCPLDTWNGVRIVRQLSDTACIQGQNWGFDRNGVWVAQGCRADFASGDGYGYGTGNPGQVFRCESTDGRLRVCPTDTRGGVQLVRQLSGAACMAGRSWGWDDRSVWVSYGCRAEFRSGVGLSGQPDNARIVRCESDDGHYRQCPAEARGGARVARQISGQPCVEGRSWGVNAGGIWVDNGCRADFELGNRNGYGWAWGDRRDPGGWSGGSYGSQANTIRCESTDNRTHRCNQPTRGARLQRQLSDAVCQQDETWGWDPGGVWVAGGCRAEFAVW